MRHESGHTREFLWLDVFTGQPFAGNPLAVFLDGTGLTTDQMQRLARELNLSETTFVLPPSRPGATHRVRIFTASYEMPFAGHPTIGTALVIRDRLGGGNDLVLDELIGNVPVSVRGERVTLTTATIPTAALPPPTVTAEFVAHLLRIEVGDLADADTSSVLSVSSGPDFLTVPVRSAEVLSRLRALSVPSDLVGIYVVAATSKGWQARMFFGGGGAVVEDPATGSAACAFAAWLHRTGRLAEGSNAVAITQGIEMGRPSQLALEVEVSGGGIGAVRLSGSAVVIAEGRMQVPELSDAT